MRLSLATELGNGLTKFTTYGDEDEDTSADTVASLSDASTSSWLTTRLIRSGLPHIELPSIIITASHVSLCLPLSVHLSAHLSAPLFSSIGRPCLV